MPSSLTQSQLSLQDFYSVKVRIDSEHVIETLMDKKEFTVAHDYARVVGAESDQISVKEVILHFTVYSIITASITVN